MGSPQRYLSGVAVVVLVVTLAACSSSSKSDAAKPTGSSPAASASASSTTTSGSSSTATVAATCKQLTIAEIQPLVTDPITNVTVKAVSAAQYTGGTETVGQECDFATHSTADAMVVIVVGGSAASRAYQGDIQGFGSGSIAVSGVGDKAARAEVDSKGSAATMLLASIKGKTYCSVLPGDGAIPGTGQLEEAAGGTSDIGATAYAEVATAIGTVCNRIFGSGSTTPDLTALAAAGSAASSQATTTTGLPTGLEP